MPASLDNYRSDLKNLVQVGEEMLVDLSLRDAAVEQEPLALAERMKGSFERNYQRWYTEARAVVEQLLTARADEFSQLYLGDGKRKTIDAATYTIQDWLTGRRAPADSAGNGKSFNDRVVVSLRMKTQLEILRSAEARFDSSLFDIRQLVQAELFDSELDACRELSSRGFLRAAGSIAGVVLERHLLRVLANHNIVVRKKEPTINDFNDRLKKADVLDVPAWRQIQRLADIRNLCSHSKHREPRKKEVDELIEGVDKLTRTLF